MDAVERVELEAAYREGWCAGYALCDNGGVNWQSNIDYDWERSSARIALGRLTSSDQPKETAP